MGRLLLRRSTIALVTLVLVSVIVFGGAQLLPGNVGRNVLGGFASQQSVDRLNHELGVDRPIYVQYGSWIGHLARGDLGTSLEYRVPIWPLLRSSLLNSLELAALAFVLVVPLSILAGVAAALRRERLADRAITLTGIGLTAVPEFVSAIVLILVFGVAFKLLPVTAQAPAGSGFFTHLKYLLLPSLALAAAIFGYISRMARAGMISALEADYTRTAYLNGLSTPAVVRRHVLRNSLLPTIAVIAAQIGPLIGGLVVVEKLFNYDGIGQRIYTAAQTKDFPMLQSSALLVAVVYLSASLAADVLYALLNPRIRHAASS